MRKLSPLLAFVLSVCLGCTGGPGNQGDDCCSLTGEADPGGGLPAFAPGEPVTVAVFKYELDPTCVQQPCYSGTLESTPVTKEVTTTADEGYAYSIPLPKDLIGDFADDENRYVVKAWTESGDQFGYYLLMSDIVDGQDIALPAISKKSSAQYLVEKEALAAWSNGAATGYGTQPSRAFIRLIMNPGLASAIFNEDVPVGDLALLMMNSRYQSYSSLYSEAGGTGSFDDQWPQVIAGVRDALVSLDDSEAVDTGQFAEQGDQVIQDYFDGLPGVEGWRAACRFADADQSAGLSVFSQIKNLPEPLRTRVYAATSKRLVGTHRLAWQVATERARQIVPTVPPNPPLGFVDTAVGNFDQLITAPNPDPTLPAAIWNQYSAQYDIGQQLLLGDSGVFMSGFLNTVDASGALTNNVVPQYDFGGPLANARDAAVGAVVNDPDGVDPVEAEALMAQIRAEALNAAIAMQDILSQGIINDAAERQEFMELTACMITLGISNDPTPNALDP